MHGIDLAERIKLILVKLRVEQRGQAVGIGDRLEWVTIVVDLERRRLVSRLAGSRVDRVDGQRM